MAGTWVDFWSGRGAVVRAQGVTRPGLGPWYYDFPELILAKLLNHSLWS